MNALKIVIITIALAAGAAGAAQASPWQSYDSCTTASAHGVWDCR